MKKKGSIAEFGAQRDAELIKAFKAQLYLLGSVPNDELFVKASKMPASRFWVSESRAEVVIRKMFKGDRLEGMNPKKREMYTEIFRRVRREMTMEPSMGIPEATFKAVNSQAPEFYLTPKSARVMIYRIRS